MSQIIPVPRCEISIRDATMADLPFIDGLQKMHSKQVGWMPEKALVGKIEAGQVIVAEEAVASGQLPVAGEAALLATGNSQLATPIGYCIGTDQYFKRDDVGIIYQMNVMPDHQRSLIGATLVKAMFERAAYGCRLFCCWCAQDIEANYFWESLGFVPLAFRAGSRDKGRVHIFWQRRVRADDETTPYWFPSQTTSGSIREDRLVFPIPPGTHWSDAKPVILPAERKQLPTAKEKEARKVAKQMPERHGLWFEAPKPKPVVEKPKREKKPKIKHDPKHVAAARELRDRWLEQVNAPGGAARLLRRGKYDLGRALASPTAMGWGARQPQALAA